MLPPVHLIDTASGRHLLFETDDLISSNLRAYGSWEPAWVALAQRLLALSGKERGTVIDAGANLGAFTIPLARQVSEQISFRCFEIQRVVFYQLCANILVTRLQNAYAHHIGLGNTDQMIDLPVVDYESATNIGGFSASEDVRGLSGTPGKDSKESSTESIRFRTLDSFGFEDVLLLKIDVDGMELDVIYGTGRYTKRDRDARTLRLPANAVRSVG